MSTAISRVYADTSVYGGSFDDEFRRPSRLFFKAVERGHLQLVTSVLVDEELENAPARVGEWFAQYRRYAEVVDITDGALGLRRAYLEAGIVSPQSAADALHVALASVNLCSILVSWNCRHIVHFHRIPRYNAVNRLKGYPDLAIHTPLEVIGDEDEAI